MKVIIDGVEYEPANQQAFSRIGIAISTHQRPEVLFRAVSQHMKHLPTGALVVVVDDGSVPVAIVPEGIRLIRHEKSQGIVASKNAKDFLDRHRNDVMLNAGLLGGQRADVMAFAHAIVRLFYRIESYRFWKMEKAAAAIGDMIAFGIVAKSFGDRIVTGPLVHTVFRTEGTGKEYAWWQHK